MSGMLSGERNRLERTLRKLEDAGGTLPTEITDAAATCERITAEAAEIGTPDDHRAAIATKLLDGETVKPADWHNLACVLEKHAVYAEAADRATREYVGICQAHGDDILAEVRRVWHTPAVEALTAAANNTTSGDTPDELIRRGKTEAATQLALAPVALAEIRQATDVQRTLYSLPGVALAAWTNPDLPAAGNTNVAQYLDAIRAGNQPWLPTLEEFEEAREVLRVKAQREAGNRPRLHYSQLSVGI